MSSIFLSPTSFFTTRYCNIKVYRGNDHGIDLIHKSSRNHFWASTSSKIQRRIKRDAERGIKIATE